jgi:amidohydrolase
MLRTIMSLWTVVLTFSVGQVSAENNPLQAVFKANQAEFAKIRHHLHEMPEIKFQEFKTSAYIAKSLEGLGYKVQSNIGGTTGLTAVLDSGRPGKTVAIRADMDGLPIMEQTKVDYKSKHEGMMHACGHDGHMATVLMVAKVLSERKDLFKGKIKFIFQPGEESGGGAKVLIDAGVLEAPKVDAIFGFHNWPLPKGDVATRVGTLMASTDHFEITIKGKGGHAAMPHLTKNPIIVGTHIIQGLQTLVSQKDPTDAVVMNIGAFQAGTTTNVVPDTAVIKGTYRTVSTNTRKMLQEKLQTIAGNCCNSMDATFELKYNAIGYPPTVNSKDGVDLVLTAAKEIVPSESVYQLEHPVMPGEDFAFYLEKIPGCFFFVGFGQDGPALHTAEYNFDDDIMATAGYVIARSAVEYLNAEK